MINIIYFKFQYGSTVIECRREIDKARYTLNSSMVLLS